MAYERGLLNGPDLNDIQEKILLTVIIRRKRTQNSDKEELFEQTLMIHQPEAYQEYRRNKEISKNDNYGFDEIVWRTPESIEEAMEVTKIVAEAHKGLNLDDDDNFDEQFAIFQKNLANIDTDLIGDEDD